MYVLVMKYCESSRNVTNNGHLSNDNNNNCNNKKICYNSNENYN